MNVLSVKITPHVKIFYVKLTNWISWLLCDYKFPMRGWHLTDDDTKEPAMWLLQTDKKSSSLTIMNWTNIATLMKHINCRQFLTIVCEWQLCDYVTMKLIIPNNYMHVNDDQLSDMLYYCFRMMEYSPALYPAGNLQNLSALLFCDEATAVVPLLEPLGTVWQLRTTNLAVL